MTLQELSDLNFELAFYTSADVDIVNNTAVKLINAVAEKNGGTCYIGKYWSEKKGLQKYCQTMLEVFKDIQQEYPTVTFEIIS